MSSDGKLVFVVEQLGLGVTGQYNNFIVFGNGRGDPAGRAAGNRLTAYELRTEGKHIWIHGEPDDPDLHDTFFLGGAVVPPRA